MKQCDYCSQFSVRRLRKWNLCSTCGAIYTDDQTPAKDSARFSAENQKREAFIQQKLAEKGITKPTSSGCSSYSKKMITFVLMALIGLIMELALVGAGVDFGVVLLFAIITFIGIIGFLYMAFWGKVDDKEADYNAQRKKIIDELKDELPRVESVKYKSILPAANSPYNSFSWAEYCKAYHFCTTDELNGLTSKRATQLMLLSFNAESKEFNTEVLSVASTLNAHNMFGDDFVFLGIDTDYFSYPLSTEQIIRYMEESIQMMTESYIRPCVCEKNVKAMMDVFGLGAKGVAGSDQTRIAIFHKIKDCAKQFYDQYKSVIAAQTQRIDSATNYIKEHIKKRATGLGYDVITSDVGYAVTHTIVDGLAKKGQENHQFIEGSKYMERAMTGCSKKVEEDARSLYDRVVKTAYEAVLSDIKALVESISKKKPNYLIELEQKIKQL